MGSAPRGYSWRGRRACQCVIDATADFERLSGTSLEGVIWQACYSFAKESAGTHGGGGALDTTSLTDRQIEVARSIGFWPSNRTRSQGLSSDHAHWVLFGCPHQAAGLAWQESELRDGRNGLARRRSDTDPRPATILSYRQWTTSELKPGYIRVGPTVQKDLVRMSVATTNRGRRKLGKHCRETWYVQRWLRKAGLYKSPLDGTWGEVTQAAFDRFRRLLGWPERDCVGPVGLTSLTRLRDAAGSRKPIVG